MPEKTGKSASLQGRLGVALSPRELFPRGLLQPEGAYRSGADALWLADFVSLPSCGASASSSPFLFADLGTGSGAAAFALLLRGEKLCPVRGLGLELDPELAEAARANARQLELEAHFQVFTGDVRDPLFLSDSRESLCGKGPDCGFDLVLANPPWRLEGQGRPPSSARRRQALFGTAETLPAFAEAAAFLLRPGGRFAWVAGADRLADACAALAAASLVPRRLRCIHAHAKAPAMLVLLEAEKRRGAGSRTHPPLALEAPLLLR